MVNNSIKLSELNLEELSGVVSRYPWFALARKVLCERMAALGEGAWSEEKFAEQALYMGSRRIIRDIFAGSQKEDCTDGNIDSLLNSYFEPKEEKKKEIFVAGGDFFSKEQYEKARTSDDDMIASLGISDSNADAPLVSFEEFTDFCTESLAQVYLDQGYVDQAKAIYSKLSLRYPEKSVYFAALIEKIDKNI